MGCKCDKRSKNDCCFNCCKEDELVQDKLCTKFEVKHEGRIIYTSNIDPRKLFASGTIENEGAAALKVEFLLGKMHDGHPIIVEPGSTLAFTRTNFNAIKVTAVHHSTPWVAYDDNSADEVDAQSRHPRPPSPYPRPEPTKGELCITPRYFV